MGKMDGYLGNGEPDDFDEQDCGVFDDDLPWFECVCSKCGWQFEAHCEDTLCEECYYQMIDWD